jgi:tetratricopeptide (TPR) repeat protein
MNLVNRAYKLYFEGDIDAAEKQLERMIKRRIKDFRVWMLNAMIKNRKGEYEEALESVEKSIELNPKNHEAWILKGFILKKMSNFTEALYSFETAVKIQIENDNYIDYETKIEIADLLITLGMEKRAEKVIKELESLIPEDENIKNLRGKLKELKKG